MQCYTFLCLPSEVQRHNGRHLLASNLCMLHTNISLPPTDLLKFNFHIELEEIIGFPALSFKIPLIFYALGYMKILVEEKDPRENVVREHVLLEYKELSFQQSWHL